MGDQPAYKEPLDVVPIFAKCDVDPMRRKALSRAYTAKFQAVHLHSGIEERLPRDTREQVRKLVPATNTWLLAKQFAYDQIRDHIHTAFVERPHLCNLSHCSLHDEYCPVHPDLGTGKLYGVSGGIICKDVSAYGLLEGDGGKSMVAQHTWIEERQRGTEQMPLPSVQNGGVPKLLPGLWRIVFVLGT